jgi:hypothetical protein
MDPEVRGSQVSSPEVRWAKPVMEMTVARPGACQIGDWIDQE